MHVEIFVSPKLPSTGCAMLFAHSSLMSLLYADSTLYPLLYAFNTPYKPYD